MRTRSHAQGESMQVAGCKLHLVKDTDCNPKTSFTLPYTFLKGKISLHHHTLLSTPVHDYKEKGEHKSAKVYTLQIFFVPLYRVQKTSPIWLLLRHTHDFGRSCA